MLKFQFLKRIQYLLKASALLAGIVHGVVVQIAILVSFKVFVITALNATIVFEVCSYSTSTSAKRSFLQ